ncbi:MAG: hypothetical protein EBY21_06620, partial [Alphaproteobacteria bacterium]|nr:hypothetical protein [Alphaproteobacteria bacterium]
MVNDQSIKSCTALAVSLQGANVTTIEGLAKDGQLHPMQEAFRQNHGLQCGFCTPGMIMSAIDIVKRNGSKLDEKIVREDFRFLTGKGHYTDDINRPGQAHAFFLRSPHAHAEILKIETSAAQSMPGVLAVFTGADLAADKIGGLICGWMIHSKDGSPMKAGSHPALAQGKVRYVGDHVAVIIAETLEQARVAAEHIKVDYKVLPAVIDMEAAVRPGSAVVHDVAPDNRVYQWHLGDQAAADAAFKKAAHVTRLEIVNNRLVPNAMEPRAAIGDYDSGADSFTLYTTSQNPHVARLV